MGHKLFSQVTKESQFFLFAFVSVLRAKNKRLSIILLFIQ